MSPMKQGPRLEPEGEESHPNGSSSDESEERRPFRPRGGGSLDFKVGIHEFEGQLDPDLFLECLWTVKRVFDYKDIPEEKR